MVLYWKVWKESEKRPFIKLYSTWYPYCAQLLSHVWLFVTTWTVACQAPLSMGFSRQGYWSGLPFPSPGYLSIPGIEPRSPTLQGDSLLSEPPGKPKNTRVNCHFLLQENLSVQGSNTCLLISRQILYYWATWEAPHCIVLLKNC